MSVANTPVINGAVYVDPTTGITYQGENGAWVEVVLSSPPTLPTSISPMTILGNNTGSTAEPTGLTAAQIKALLAIQASDVAGVVPATLIINGHELTGNISLVPSDVGALPNNATVNGYEVLSNPVLEASDVGAVPVSALGASVPTLVNGTVPSSQLPTMTVPMSGATAGSAGVGGSTPSPLSGQQNDVLAGAAAYQDSAINAQVWS
jgi:hypothetical protein